MTQLLLLRLLFLSLLLLAFPLLPLLLGLACSPSLPCPHIQATRASSIGSY